MRTRALIALLLIGGVLAAYLLTRERSLPLGVHTLHADDRALRQVHDLGAQYVVQVFSWSEIEPSPGEFHWEETDWLLRAAEFYNLRVIARLDNPPDWAVAAPAGLSGPPKRVDDYAAFAGEVAARYRGRIAGYIIWNEPNLAREWGNQPPDPAGYAELLKAASARLRAVDPGARILSAGLAPTNEHSAAALDDRDFLRALYAAGAGGAFDALAAHPYGFANPPDDPRGAHDGLNFARLQDLRDIMVANGDAAKPIWITEFGYPTNPTPSGNPEVTESQQADYLVRAYEIAREKWSWVQVFTIWDLAQGVAPTDEAEGYSLVRADGSPRPAYARVRTMPRASAEETLIRALAGSLSAPPAQAEYPVLARDAVVHLGDSEYSSPWVALYQNRNPSTIWQGEFYLRPADLSGARGQRDWTLSMELMQVNDLDNRLLVNGQPARPAYLPDQDFTSIWATAQFRVAAADLRLGLNTVTVRDGKLFPAFQHEGFVWDNLQLRNLILTPPQ